MDDPVFPPTQWSAVLQAAGADPAKARRAFERLCADYRDAIAHWMRLQRLTPEDAEDAAHDFLAQWLRRENPLQGFQRGERRFREFLRVCLRRFLADWRERRRTIRSGRGFEHVPLELDDDVPEGGPERADLDFTFAAQIRQTALAGLKLKWETKLPGERFDRLQAIALGDKENPGYETLADELGTKVGTVKSWMFRLRHEYHEAFRDAVSQLADPSEVGHEVLYLHNLLLAEGNKISESLQPPPSASR